MVAIIIIYDRFNWHLPSKPWVECKKTKQRWFLLKDTQSKFWVSFNLSSALRCTSMNVTSGCRYNGRWLSTRGESLRKGHDVNPIPHLHAALAHKTQGTHTMLHTVDGERKRGTSVRIQGTRATEDQAPGGGCQTSPGQLKLLIGHLAQTNNKTLLFKNFSF